MKDQSEKRKNKKRGPRPGTKYRHGGYSLMMRGILPERRRYIGLYLTTVREGLIHDLAAKEEDLSTAQRVLIDRVITFLGVARLIEEHAREQGILDSRGRLSQGLTGHYLSFNRFIKETMALLGLEKRSVEPEATFAEIVKRYDKKVETKTRDASGPSSEAIGASRTGDLPLVKPMVEDQGVEKATGIDCDIESGRGQDPEGKGIDQPELLGEDGQGQGSGPGEDEQV